MSKKWASPSDLPYIGEDPSKLTLLKDKIITPIVRKKS